MVIKRFDVYIINLDPTIGSEIRKSRPCVIISPDEINKYLNTVIIAPLTSTIKNYPTRINCKIKNKKGQIVLDQIRTIDKSRLINKIGKIDYRTSLNVCNLLIEMFQY